MKKYILLFLCLITVSGSFAQMKDFKFKFYGQIRTDFYLTVVPMKKLWTDCFICIPKTRYATRTGMT